MTSYDVVVVGGGIVGVATARALLRARPGLSLLLVDKEPRLAVHQSGHNSGVVHAGVYYPPGSLKSRLCRAGAAVTLALCEEHGLPIRRHGKLIVATMTAELGPLSDLGDRAAASGIAIQRVSAPELGELEPHVTGLAALLVPGSASVDYGQVTQALGVEIERLGAQVRTGRAVARVQQRSDAVEIVSREEEVWRARHLVVCAGVQADRLARLCGLELDVRMVPFRGEYYRLAPDRAGIVSRLVYPVPDPELPFLGVHLTPMVDGTTTVGPNAVLGLAREGYAKGSVSGRDVLDLARYPGVWRMARRYWRVGVPEVAASLFKGRYLDRVRRYCPDLRATDLLPYEAGIRAQLVRRDGTLVEDFLIERTARMTHVLNAPSPGATSAIPIGEHIAREVLTRDP